jgi:hypothetical protein
MDVLDHWRDEETARRYDRLACERVCDPRVSRVETTAAAMAARRSGRRGRGG